MTKILIMERKLIALENLLPESSDCPGGRQAGARAAAEGQVLLQHRHITKLDKAPALRDLRLQFGKTHLNK